MRKKKKKNKQYLSVDHLIYKESGWSTSDVDFFVDGFIDLVETLKAKTNGVFGRLTEEQVEQEDNRNEEN